MNYNLINEARKALNPVWVIAWLRGRCWGEKRNDNLHGGSNINLFVGKESVTVSQHGDKLAIYEFCQTKNTKLGRMVRELLLRAGMQIDDGDAVAGKTAKKPQEPYFMWGCEKCKKRGIIEYQDGDSFMVIAGHTFKEHATFSPGCGYLNIRIVDHNMVEQKEFTHYLSLVNVSK